MRTHYFNGDEITLKATGCDGCNPSMVNGVLCHESGCPDAWRDSERECVWCGYLFSPSESTERFCSGSCCDSYHGAFRLNTA